MPQAPQRSTQARRVQVPAGIVDQGLRRLIFRNPFQNRAHAGRLVQIDAGEQRQENLLDRRHQALGGDAAPGRLHRDLGNADEAGIALQSQQHERGRLLDDVAPAHWPRVAQPVAMQRMLGEAHGAPFQSAVTPDARINCPHLGDSTATKPVSCSGLMYLGSAPSWTILSRTSGSRTIFSISALSFATIGSGVPRGAKSAYQPRTSKSGKPSSATVGTFGTSWLRAALVMARARSLPASTCGSNAGTVKNMKVTSPDSTPVTASGPLLYGTWCTSMRAVLFRSSAARCPDVPVPAEENVN